MTVLVIIISQIYPMTRMARIIFHTYFTYSPTAFATETDKIKKK